MRIATPYFLPEPTIIAALNLAALRGVTVDIVLPSRCNRETHDAPANEERFHVFLGVDDEPCGAIVPATACDEDSALDLDHRAGVDVGEVGAPFPLG